MRETPKTSRKAVAHLAGAGAYILTSLVGMVAYVLFFKATGPKLTGFAGGAIVIFLPMMLLMFGLFIWAPVWAFMKHKWGVVTPLQALGFTALISAIATLPYCGFRCFMTGSTEHMVGWFFVTFAAMGAAAHSGIYLRIIKK